MTRSFEIAVALTILVARPFAVPPALLLTDPVFVLALLWIFLAAGSKTRAAEPAVLAVSAVLFVAYAWRQLPYTIDLLRQTF